jgi:leucyl-tRNA synthetase
LDILLELLAPMAPHITEELWQASGHADSVHEQVWPKYDPNLLVDDIITIVVQVNGKVRDKLEVAHGISESELQKLAFASEKVMAATNGQAAKNVIHVPGRLINIVV